MLLPKNFRTKFDLTVAFNVVMIMVLCTSATYWALHLSTSQQRPVAVAPTAAMQIDNAATALLFGSGSSSAIASNFQLRGIVLAPNVSDSVAIIVADGKPARALKIGSEIVVGANLQHINADHILISDNGVQKRVPLPSSTTPPPSPSPSTINRSDLKD